MRTDRELLELAAKAGGIKIDLTYTDQFPPTSLPHGYLVVINASGGHSFWNPLDDDGDAMRLAVKLRFTLIIVDYGATVRANEQGRWTAYEAHLHGGIESATRRAIVRAAAEIGAASPPALNQEGGSNGIS